MRAENLSVAAAFDLSYQELPGDQQRLFRRLGLDAARRGLEGLYDQHLLTEPARGRYRLHDLLREHAHALAADDEAAGSDAATGRLLDYYLHTALAAGTHLQVRWPARRLPPPGTPPACAPRFAALRQATAWLEAERANPHAAAGYAAASGFGLYSIVIPAAMSDFLLGRGHWEQAAALYQTALTTAGQAGARPEQVGALVQLGIVQWLTGDYPAAGASLTRALDLYRDLGDRPGQARALTQLGVLHELTGDHEAAAASHQQALELFRDRGQRLGEAEALNNLGELLTQSRDSHRARSCHARALALAREISVPMEEARALEGIGQCHLHDGNLAEGAAQLRQALAIYQRIGTPAARRIQEILRQHDLRKAPGGHGAPSAGPG